MAYKLDADPAVHAAAAPARLPRRARLVLHRHRTAKYPTLIEAQQHAVPAAHFGTGPDAVTVWRVSSRWRP